MDGDAQGDLLMAAMTQEVDEAALAIANGANVNAANEHGMTALHVACAGTGPAAMLDLLFKHAADVNCPDKEGWTAIMYAASAGQKGLVTQLLQAGADINARAAPGWSALSRAALKGHASIVQQLLAAGADASCADSGEGKNILHHAATSGCPETHRFLQAAMEGSAVSATQSAGGAGGEASPAAADQLAYVLSKSPIRDSTDKQKRSIECAVSSGPHGEGSSAR